MTALTYREDMAGYVASDTDEYNEGWIAGREQRNDCRFWLDVAIDDVARFVADPDHEAPCTGHVRCDGLGGDLTIEAGTFNLLVAVDGPRHRQMRYALKLRDGAGRPLTLRGFKSVDDDAFNDTWSDTSTLFTRVYAGHVDDDERPEARLATGILRVSSAGFARLLASMRAHGGSPPDRLRARARYVRLFVGALARVYRGPQTPEGQPDFPTPRPGAEPFHGHREGQWHDCPSRPGLRRRIIGVRAGDGRLLTLHNIRGARDDGHPVLLVHGTGVRANLFYGAPVATTVVDALIDAGYDVWLENWRASIDLPTCEFTLDEGAVHDHPAAVRAVLAHTGADTLKALIHCQGSTSFTMAALAGLVPEVTHIVSNAVSLFVDVPRMSALRLSVLVPAMARFMPGLDPQWAIRPPAPPALMYARAAELLRADRQCHNAVCAVANFTYGAGPDVLWRHANLSDATHRWVSREFGWVPVSFFAQMAACVRAGHVVAVDPAIRGLPPDATEQPPRTDAVFTLLGGAQNRCFLPSGQQRTHAWLEGHAPGRHALHVLPGYSHLDVFFGRDAARDVHPLILEGLRR